MPRNGDLVGNHGRRESLMMKAEFHSMGKRS